MCGVDLDKKADVSTADSVELNAVQLIQVRNIF